MAERSDDLHAVFGRLSFSRATLPRNYNGLLRIIVYHCVVCSSGHHVHMRYLILEVPVEDGLPHLVDYLFIEKSLNDAIRVDYDQGGSNVCENLIFFVPLDQIVEHFGLVEDIHFAHVRVQLPLRHLKGIF